MLDWIIFAGILIFLILLIGTVFVHIFFLVPYVPSRPQVIKKMIQLAKLKHGEIVYDLGCGDGRLLIEAEKHKKIKGVGFEIAPLVYIWALIKKVLNKSKFDIRFKNFFKTDLGKADVIFCYLMPSVMKSLSLKIKGECKKGTRIISHTFHLPDFKPTKILKKTRPNLPTIYLYRI